MYMLYLLFTDLISRENHFHEVEENLPKSTEIMKFGENVLLVHFSERDTAVASAEAVKGLCPKVQILRKGHIEKEYRNGVEHDARVLLFKVEK